MDNPKLNANHFYKLQEIKRSKIYKNTEQFLNLNEQRKKKRPKISVKKLVKTSNFPNVGAWASEIHSLFIPFQKNCCSFCQIITSPKKERTELLPLASRFEGDDETFCFVLFFLHFCKECVRTAEFIKTHLRNPFQMDKIRKFSSTLFSNR